MDVSFDVESREYNGRWYTDVKAWKVLGKQQSGNQQPQGSSYATAPFSGNASNADLDDDLPF